MGRLRFFESKKSDDLALAVNSRSHNSHRSMNRNYQIKEAKIKEITGLFNKGRIDVGDFLRALAADENRMYTLSAFTFLSFES